MAATNGQVNIGKHLQLSKAQTTTFVVTAVAVFLVVFTFVAAKSLLSQSSFQGKVIDGKQKALDQLKSNQKTAKQLADSYQAFVGTTQNAIGGDPNGSGPQDGNNAKLVMDALPGKYDFPALTSSLEKIISGQSMSIKSIAGQDDQINQQDNTSSATPKPVNMPFSITASGNYGQVQSLVGQFEHSIRPFQIQTLDIKGDQSNLTVSITAQTYYQPSKNFNIKTEVVK